MTTAVCQHKKQFDSTVAGSLPQPSPHDCSTAAPPPSRSCMQHQARGSSTLGPLAWLRLQTIVFFSLAFSGTAAGYKAWRGEVEAGWPTHQRAAAAAAARPLRCRVACGQSRRSASAGWDGVLSPHAVCCKFHHPTPKQSEHVQMWYRQHAEPRGLASDCKRAGSTGMQGRTSAWRVRSTACPRATTAATLLPMQQCCSEAPQLTGLDGCSAAAKCGGGGGRCLCCEWQVWCRDGRPCSSDLCVSDHRPG